MSRSVRSSRREFLRGLGVAVALPALERTLAGATTAAKPATSTTGAPLRMAYLYTPNGVNTSRWRPEGVGADYQLNESMAPLQDLKDSFQIFSQLEHKNGWAGPDGAGDHARANATMLTGMRAKKTAGADIKLGVSVDQLAAQKVGDQTRFPSLELSCDGVRKSGNCDSGYSCAYSYNLSWRSETAPVAPESNPRLVFERLFGAGEAHERKAAAKLRLQREQSILDVITADAKRLNAELGRNDRQKLDEYFTGIRAIERRLQRTAQFGPPPDPGVDAPENTPPDYQEHLRLMLDMLVLAFQTDSTRVATFLLAHEGSNRTFDAIGVPEGHHYLSHHADDPVKLTKIAKIDRFYLSQLAYFLQQLKQTKDVDGQSVLDNSMIVYCSGLADPNRHAHNNLPVILAGGGGGQLTPGRHVKLASDTPMNNLYVSLLDRFGVPVDQFGDSTGKLTDL